ncbi:serine/threonine-protein kinase [Amycolatopsis sp. 195334CR]|uniref:serine/threonine-protein kinase n=1 Tax=Amycolatopsis sp. 195334CR TaxID=2814588 RepID=UPI001A8D1A81|nr:serine/threonine-protein kinase [Amycolatopsis sp. 195334CR]MBN6035517.1 serine/threonine protein kinase [Amycolatopsis sp. 195334CR]
MSDWTLPGFAEVKALGEGGFGRVVLARQDGTGAEVAIKYLYAEHLGDPRLVDAFRQEARVLSQVVSPHVARLHEFIETPEGAAIVMEAVPGVSLSAILTAEGQLAPEAALVVLKGSLLGLSAAHTAGVVHRDYKPDNVLVQPNRQSKLVDFGIAVLAGETGLSVGTPGYMAPEQWAGKAATPATDVYAATCVFFQCVTGNRPYRADDRDTLRNLHIYAPIPFGEVPESLWQLVERGMAKDPAHRPGSAAIFLAELESAAVAAYGPDWEDRGWTRLAQRAAALLAVSPLAMLAGATMLAPAGAGAVAGSGGVVAAGAGGGVLVKAGAILVGAALVGTGAVIVVNTTTGDDPPPPPPPAIEQVAMTANVLNRTENFGTYDFNGQYVAIGGLADPAVQERVNQALMAPVDGWIEYVREVNPDPATDTPHLSTQAEIRRQDDKVISVKYTRRIDSTQFGNRGGFSIRGVTVDLKTGEAIDAPKVFPDAAAGQAGATALEERLLARSPGGFCGGNTEHEPMEPRHLTEPYTAGDGDPAVQAIFAADAVEFDVYGSAFGGPMACDHQTVTVPYTDLTDLMAPEAAQLLGTGAAAPSADQRLDLGPFTLTVPQEWRLSNESATGRLLARAADCVQDGCPGVRIYYRSAVEHQPGEPCTPAPDQLITGAERLKQELRPVGTKKAAYEEWRITCSGGADFVERSWTLPKTGIIFADDWNTPGLDKILEGATWR